MLVLHHSDWLPTGHNELNIDEQPILKRAPCLRESKFILVSVNIANITSCMTNDHPTHILCPILGNCLCPPIQGKQVQCNLLLSELHFVLQ